MLERFIKKVNFNSMEDFNENFKIEVPENFNFAYDIVDEWARKEPDKRALCWTNDKGEHRDFTFSELKDLSDRAASFFLSIGIEKGDKIMLILKRHYEFWISILALHKIGAIAIPATHLLTEKDIVYRNQMAQVRGIVSCIDELVVESINQAKQESPSVEFYIGIGEEAPYGWMSFNEGLEKAAPFSRPENNTCNEDIMLLYFTSGTSGNPKMVIHNFTYPLAHIVTAKYWHNLDENSLHLTVADTGWAKAVWGKLYGQWIVGACVFVYDHEKFHPLDILRLIEKYKITSFCAPPTIYRFIIKEDMSNFDLSSLKECTTAGEALNFSVFETFYKNTGIRIREAFGQTEVTAIIITYPWIEAIPGAMGVLNPLYDTQLITAEGQIAKEGEEGEIVIKHTTDHPLGLFSGYYGDEERTRKVYSSYGYHTGDIARKDGKGYYWYEGRADDMIKSSGYRIGPFEVESALLTHPAIVECAITAIPDEIRGHVVKATVVLGLNYKEQADDNLAKEIQEHVKQVTAPYKYPRIVEFVDVLPKTISGKIKRAEIRTIDSKTRLA
jgi:acetyl-CoA synthetase